MRCKKRKKQSGEVRVMNLRHPSYRTMGKFKARHNNVYYTAAVSSAAQNRDREINSCGRAAPHVQRPAISARSVSIYVPLEIVNRLISAEPADQCALEKVKTGLCEENTLNVSG